MRFSSILAFSVAFAASHVIAMAVVPVEGSLENVNPIEPEYLLGRKPLKMYDRGRFGFSDDQGNPGISSLIGSRRLLR